MTAKSKYLALATDYDGTIAQHGDMTRSTFAALERWKEAGRKLLMVTGRELPDLQKVCPFTKSFDCIVAENGALLFWPATGKKVLLAHAPPANFTECLRARGVSPLSFGEAIVSTQENYKSVVLEVIEDLGLKLKVILNKGALMVLPTDVDKATGLTAAAESMGIALADIVGVGDAENDQVFLSLCGYSAAVGNALPFLKRQAHYVAKATHGAGVEELIDKLLAAEGSLPEKSEQPELFTGKESALKPSTSDKGGTHANPENFTS